MEDREIVDLFWERKEAAISASADKYGKYCNSISYNILHNKEDAEECVNETWLAAWKSIPPNRPRRLSSFLGKITRNLSLDRLKKYSAEKRGCGQAELALAELMDCISDEESVERIVDELVLVKTINDFLREQPEKRRNIFIRRYWYLFSIKEIAADYAMSEGNVASVLFRMRADLKERLKKEGIYL